MRRRDFIFALAGAALSVPLTAAAQPVGKVHRIGYLASGVGSPSTPNAHLTEAFRQGLRELGWIEGQNIAIEYRWAEGRFAYHKQEIIPSRALDELLRIHQERTASEAKPPVIFHAYDWGGYLTWHGWPRVRNWIDDRNEVQGKEHVEAYFSLLRAEPGWRETFRDADVALVCVFPEAPLARRLAREAGWEERYRDEHAVIFARRAVE